LLTRPTPTPTARPNRLPSQEDRHRLEAKQKDPKGVMIWKLVPVRLRRTWTKAELVWDLYEPEEPGEFQDRDALPFNQHIRRHILKKENYEFDDI
jgi:hypothetical protein